MSNQLYDSSSDWINFQLHPVGYFFPIILDCDLKGMEKHVNFEKNVWHLQLKQVLPILH